MAISRVNARGRKAQQGVLVKYQTIVTGLISCLVSLFLWSFNHYDYKSTNLGNTNVAVLGDFEAAKNNLEMSINLCLSNGVLSESEKKTRSDLLSSLVRKAMVASKTIPSDALFHLAIFTRFDDTSKYYNLCNAPPETLQNVKKSITARELQLRQELS